MDDRLIEFSGILRRYGISASLSEMIDAFHGVELAGIEEPYRFRDALRCTLVKRQADAEIFDDLFHLYFFGLDASDAGSDRALMHAMGLSEGAFQELVDQIRRLVGDRRIELSSLTRALLLGRTAEVERLLRGAAERERLVFGHGRLATQDALERLAARLSLQTVREQIEAFKAAARRRLKDGETSDRIRRYADERLKGLEDRIRELTERAARTHAIALRRDQENIAEKSFALYTEEDVRRMNEAVARLARHFKNLLSLRSRKSSRGRFDVKATLRKNLQYGGVPFQVLLDKRKRERPQIVVLCDISDSVLNASRFMLQLVYAMQELYGKVRSFVFVSDIGEVTGLFKELGINAAVDMALRGDIIDVFAHSNFGRAFELFHERYLSAVTGKTTLLIIGDGRNNYNPSNAWILEEIQRKAKQVIWLNPESRSTWGLGDSNMPQYAPHCAVVEECRNIKQLARIFDRTVL